MNMSKAGMPAQGDSRYIGCVPVTCGAQRRRSFLLMSVAVGALVSGANRAGAVDIANTSPFTNSGAYFGDVISNSSTINNDAPGYWTGNIQANTNTIRNNAGATWEGGIVSNRSQIINYGTWMNGAITGNGNPADPLPVVIGSNGTIYNVVGATWNGDVNGNSDLVINDGGAWNGNINGNANYILNNGGTWTGNVVANGGYGQFTQVFNGGNGFWVGDVLGNNAFVGNGGSWQGAVLGNSRTLVNSGTWTGNVAGNSGNVYNINGTWTGDVLANGGNIFNQSNNGLTAIWNGNVSGNASSIQNQAGSQWNGDVTGNAGSIANSGTWVGNVTGNAGTITNSATWTGVVANAGVFNNAGTLSGGLTNTAGVANNTGSIAGTTTVNGGTLTGNGTFASVVVNNGGSFAPGNGTPGTSATITNNLTFQSGAFYSVAINPSSAPFSSVTGSAALGGASVQVMFASGSYVARQYSILTATGGLGGSRFGSFANNLPSGFTAGLSYDGTHVYLDVSFALATTPGSTLGGNQQAVGNVVVNHFNTTGGIPVGFGALNESALSQASGQPGASTAQGGIAGTGQFVSSVFDGAFSDSGVQGGGAIGFAADEDQLRAYAAKRDRSSKAKEAAYAAVTPRDSLAPSFASRWDIWASVYGGNSRIGGDATAGTTTTTSRIFGTAVGARYRVSPDTLAGFALGGAGSNFNLDAGLGGGRSDVFNAVVYAKHNIGAAYLAGLIGYSWQDTTTDRTVTVAGMDHLHASFKAQALTGRLEGGWRYATPLVGITPYAAVQATAYHQPSYGETAISGNDTFALSYASKTVTATRGEIGARFDKAMLVQDGIFTLKAKTAWAHDWNGDRGATATFLSLPGATFVVNGATPSADAALVSLGGEMEWQNGWTLDVNFDGEFSRTVTSYAGKGSVRYTW